MGEIQNKIKNNKLHVKTKISSNDVISEQEIGILEEYSIRGLLKPKKRKRKLIEYSDLLGFNAWRI